MRKRGQRFCFTVRPLPMVALNALCRTIQSFKLTLIMLKKISSWDFHRPLLWNGAGISWICQHLYPTLPLVEYVGWRHGKSELAFDPWIARQKKQENNTECPVRAQVSWLPAISSIHALSSGSILCPTSCVPSMPYAPCGERHSVQNRRLCSTCVHKHKNILKP